MLGKSQAGIETTRLHSLGMSFAATVPHVTSFKLVMQVPMRRSQALGDLPGIRQVQSFTTGVLGYACPVVAYVPELPTSKY